jgi:hypothetical protein
MVGKFNGNKEQLRVLTREEARTEMLWFVRGMQICEYLFRSLIPN